MYLYQYLHVQSMNVNRHGIFLLEIQMLTRNM